MNKYFKYYVGIWSILLAIFNVAVFVTRSGTAGMTDFSSSFWVGYVFITIAFIMQLLVSYYVFKGQNMKRIFYKISLVSISWTSLIITLVLGTLCMVIPNPPSWIGIVLCFAVLGFNAISLLKANAAAEAVNDIDEKVKAKTEFVRMLTMDAESLMNRSKTAEAKAVCKKVYEAARFSDPMSSIELSNIESQITLKFSEFSNAVADGASNISTLGNELVILIGERNKKCRLLK